MEQLAERPEESGPVPDAEWRDFLVVQLDILSDSPLDAIEAKVDGFLTAVDLAQVSPRSAQVYFRECVARPR